MELQELLKNIDTPGWDWPKDEYTWLASESGLYRTETDGAGTSVFFIHGGRVREQSHLPYGTHSLESFKALLDNRASGLDSPHVCWLSDTGGGDPGFWVEGTRLPQQSDIDRFNAAKKQQQAADEKEVVRLQARLATSKLVAGIAPFRSSPEDAS